MLAVHEDLGLDDRDQAILLARGGVTREAVGILADGLLGGAGGARRDLEDRAPLGEAGTEAVVLGAARAKPVEAGAVRLAVGAGERLDALVDLDAGDHALLLEELDEGLALLGLLADGLVEHDAARDVLAKIGSKEEQLAVRAAVLLFVGDADRREALADGAVGLVRRQDALAAARDGLGRGGELVPVLRAGAGSCEVIGLEREAEGAGGGLGLLGLLGAGGGGTLLLRHLGLGVCWGGCSGAGHCRSRTAKADGTEDGRAGARQVDLDTQPRPHQISQTVCMRLSRSANPHGLPR